MNEYERLRDVHDHLDRINIRPFAFLIGQEGLRAVKTAFQQENKTQIVARLMVEELRFYGLRDAADTATSLQIYDTTCFPKGSDWTFTRFFAPVAAAAGYKLADDAQVLWHAFEDLHNKSNLPGEFEIPMESFARAVEITLKSCWDRDPLSLQPEPAARAGALGIGGEGLRLRAGAHRHTQGADTHERQGASHGLTDQPAPPLSATGLRQTCSRSLRSTKAGSTRRTATSSTAVGWRLRKRSSRLPGSSLA